MCEGQGFPSCVLVTIGSSQVVTDRVSPRFFKFM